MEANDGINLERLSALAAWAEIVTGEIGVAAKILQDGGERAALLVLKVTCKVTGIKEQQGCSNPCEEARIRLTTWNKVAGSRFPTVSSQASLTTPEEAMNILEILLWCGACCDQSNRGAHIQRILRLDAPSQEELMKIMKIQMAKQSAASSPRTKTPKRRLTAVREDPIGEDEEIDTEKNKKENPTPNKQGTKEVNDDEILSLRSLLNEQREVANRERDRCLAFEMRCLEAERGLTEAKESISRYEEETAKTKEQFSTCKTKLEETEHKMKALHDEIDVLRPCREKLIQSEKQLEKARELKAELREAREQLNRADGFVSDAEKRALAAETERDKLKLRAAQIDQLEDTIAELRVALEQTSQEKQAITEKAEALATLLTEAQQEQLRTSPNKQPGGDETSLADSSARETVRLTHRVAELEAALAKCDPEKNTNLQRQLDESRRYAGVWQRTAEKAKSELSKQRERYTNLEQKLISVQHRYQDVECIVLANRAELEETEAMGREERRGVWLKKRIEARNEEQRTKAIDWLRRVGNRALEKQWRSEFQILRQACTREVERRVANAKEHNDELQTYHEALSKTKDECAAELEKADAEIKCIKAEAASEKRDALAKAHADFDAQLARFKDTLDREHNVALEDVERRAATQLRQAQRDAEEQVEIAAALSEQLENAKRDHEEKLATTISELEAVHAEKLASTESTIQVAYDRRLAAAEEARAAAERLASDAQTQRTELRRQVAEETRKKLEAWDRSKKDAIEAATVATAAAKDLAQATIIESLSGDASSKTAKLSSELTAIRNELHQEQEARYAETEALKLELNEAKVQYRDAVAASKAQLESIIAEHNENLQSLRASLHEAHEQLESTKMTANAQDEQHRIKLRELSSEWTQRLAAAQDSLRAAHVAELAATCLRAEDRRHRTLEQESRSCELKLEAAVLATSQEYERRIVQLSDDFQQRERELVSELENACQGHTLALQRAIEHHEEALESQARAAEIELKAHDQNFQRLSGELEATRLEMKTYIASAESKLRATISNAETRLIQSQQNAEDQIEAERAAAEASKWLAVQSLENELNELQKTIAADREKAVQKLEEALETERTAFDDRTERLVSEHELALRASIAAMERERVSALKAAEEDKLASVAAAKRAVALQKNKAHDAAIEAAVRSAREAHAARLAQAEQQAAAEKNRLEELLDSTERRHAAQLAALNTRNGDESKLAVEAALFEAKRKEAAVVRSVIADADAAAATALDAMRALWQRQTQATNERHRDAREAAVASSCAKMYLDAIESEHVRLEAHQRELEEICQEQKLIAAKQLAEALRERDEVQSRFERETAIELENRLMEAADASQMELALRERLSTEHKRALETVLAEADAKLAQYIATQAADAEYLAQTHAHKLQAVESRLRQQFEAELDVLRDQTDTLRQELESANDARIDSDAELTSLVANLEEVKSTLKITQTERDRIQAELDAEREANAATTDEIRSKLLTMRAEAAAKLKNERESARVELTSRLASAQREAAARLSTTVEEVRAKCKAEATSAEGALRLEAERSKLAAIQEVLEAADLQRLEAVDNARSELQEELTNDYQRRVDEVKAQHQRDIIALEEKFKERQVSNDEQLSTQIESFKAQQEAAFEEQEASYQQRLTQELEALKVQHNDALKEQESSFQTYFNEQVTIIEARHEDALRNQEALHQEDLNAQLEMSRGINLTEHEGRIVELEAKHQEALSAARKEIESQHTATLEQMQQKHITELERLVAENAQTLDQVRQAHAVELDHLETEMAERAKRAVSETEAKARKVAEAAIARIGSERHEERSTAQMQELADAKQQVADLEDKLKSQECYGMKLLAQKDSKIETLTNPPFKLTREYQFFKSTRGSPTNSSVGGVSLNGVVIDPEKCAALLQKFERDYQSLSNRYNAELARKLEEAEEADDEQYAIETRRHQRLEAQLQEKTLGLSAATRETYEAKMIVEKLQNKLQDVQLENTRLAANIARVDLGRSTFSENLPTTPVGNIHVDDLDDQAALSSPNEVRKQLDKHRQERAKNSGQIPTNKKRKKTTSSAAKENVFQTPLSGNSTAAGLRY